VTNPQKLEKLRKWIKKASRDCRDKDNRGFVDELILIEEFLKELEVLLFYVDDKQLDFYKRQYKENIQ
jgi:hypothetical protein